MSHKRTTGSQLIRRRRRRSTLTALSCTQGVSSRAVRRRAPETGPDLTAAAGSHAALPPASRPSSLPPLVDDGSPPAWTTVRALSELPLLPPGSVVEPSEAPRGRLSPGGRSTCPPNEQWGRRPSPAPPLSAPSRAHLGPGRGGTGCCSSSGSSSPAARTARDVTTLGPLLLLGARAPTTGRRKVSVRLVAAVAVCCRSG